MSKIFPTADRARRRVIGRVTQRIVNALVAGAFPVIAAHSESEPCALFASMMIPKFIAAFFLVPDQSA